MSSDDDIISRIAAELARCGLPVATNSIAYSEDLQNYAAYVEAAADDAIDRFAASPFALAVDLVFALPADAKRYQTALSRRPDIQQAVRESKRDSHRWLEERGLLAGLPRLSESGDLSAFAQAIERHFGAEEGSLLKVTAGQLIMHSGNLEEVRYLLSVSDVLDFETEGVAFLLQGSDAADP